MQVSDWFDAAGNGTDVDVQGVFSTSCLDLLLGICQLGALVSFATTRDGGALGVTITLDGRWRREYFRAADELQTWLEAAYSAVRASVTASPAPAHPAPRQRRPKSL